MYPIQIEALTLLIQNNSKVILPWSDEMHFRIEKEPEPTAKEQSRDKMSHAAVKNETLMALGKRRLSNSKEGRGGRQGLKLKRLWRFYKSSYKN